MAITVDLSGIDLASLIEQEVTHVRFGKAHGHGEKRSRKGPCPWCGGTDRFAVVESYPHHHFYCGIHGGSGCGVSGDAVKFMMLWHKASFTKACQLLNVTPLNGEEELKPKQGPRVYANIDRMPVEDWRLIAAAFLRRCQAWLWHETIGKDAREWLRQRGYTDAYLKERGYGFNPKTLFDKNVKGWGIADEDAKAVWLPRGIVIPWYVGDDLWKINIRRPNKDLAAERKKRPGQEPNKYVNVKGSSNPIYRADSITPGQPLVLFEGEFNADILAMVLTNAGITGINIIATGSTGKGRADNWLAKIAKASPILISFDPDGAGAKAAKSYWAKVLPHALLWPSRGGDLNDMYLAGADIVKWLNKGLKIAGSSIEVNAPAPAPVVEPEPQTESIEQDPFDSMMPEEQQAYLEDMELPRLCAACLVDEGLETVISEDEDLCARHMAIHAHQMTPEEIAAQITAVTGMTFTSVEVFKPEDEAAVKARVEQAYGEQVYGAASRRRAAAGIDFSIQPDWTAHGFVRDEKGNWREKNRYERDLKEAALAARKK